MDVVRDAFQAPNNGSLYLLLLFEGRARPRYWRYLGYLLVAGAFQPSECWEMRPAFAFWLYLNNCSYASEDNICPWKRDFAYVVLILGSWVRIWSCLCKGSDWPRTKRLLYWHLCSVQIMGAGKTISVSSASFAKRLSVGEFCFVLHSLGFM